jgi:hypothetical protein
VILQETEYFFFGWHAVPLFLRPITSAAIPRAIGRVESWRSG